MNLALWPLVLRKDLVRAFRPGERGDREAPFRTLRDHEWATAGVTVHARQGSRAAGRIVVFSVLNLDAAIYARRGDEAMAAEMAKAAASLEGCTTFAQLQTSLAEHPRAVVSSIAEGELAAASPFVELIRTLAMKTAEVRRQHHFDKLASWYHVGRISTVAEGYVVVDGEGKQSFVPRSLARAVFRERVGECLAVMNSPVDDREMIVRAVPGIELDPEKDSYSPFARPAAGFQRVSAADLAYLRGVPRPLAITIPITIER
ncbi:MAG TPA: hypothetical protein VI197_32370 [Polyangiaceae bacterium]